MTTGASSMTEDADVLAIIGGTSLLKSALFEAFTSKKVETEFGVATVQVGKSPAGKDMVFLQRHHAGEDASVYYPPHMLDHRRSFAALRALGVTRIVAICSVGGLTPEFSPSTMVVPDDYFYLFGPSVSFYDDARGHIVPGFDAALRSKVLEILSAAEMPGLCSSSATYVQTTGPRFETRSEIKFCSTLGHIIGMTGASETTLAAELKIPYAICAMVDNFANGAGGEGLTSDDFYASVKRNQSTVEAAVTNIVRELA